MHRFLGFILLATLAGCQSNATNTVSDIPPKPTSTVELEKLTKLSISAYADCLESTTNTLTSSNEAASVIADRAHSDCEARFNVFHDTIKELYRSTVQTSEYQQADDLADSVALETQEGFKARVIEIVNYRRFQ
ncbi:hypothetical protein ABMA57_12600 [Saccharospirillum sp. HFRX-1]|uniref:hypothetical protein n=1 Tax=unclassified Saccharospirillum TaxID=2633430 RepID=UPI0037213F0E